MVTVLGNRMSTHNVDVSVVHVVEGYMIRVDMARNLLAIPKTIIFYDGIEGGQRIAAALRSNINPELASSYDGRTLVQMYFGTVDEPKKKQILSDLVSGVCRIVICTDAFGLGVDIGDIEWIIQWSIDEKVSISALTQRAGRAARRPGRLGCVFIFVPKAILEAVPEDWELGWKAREPDQTNEWVDADEDDEDDSPRVVPVSKMRPLERFGLPVTTETRSKVSAFIRNIYTEAKSIKDSFRIAKNELKGTRMASLSAAQKLDPAVLWILCTTGCRRRAMLSFYKDENAFTDIHQSWCCDRCAKLLSGQLRTLSEKIRRELENDMLSLERSISFLKSDPESHKIILLDNKNILGQQSTVFELPRLPINQLRRNRLRKQLYAARETIIARSDLPTLVIPEMIIPDAVIDHIVRGIRQINSEKSLEEQFRAAHFDIDSSLTPGGRGSIPALYRFINEALSQTAHLEEAQTRPRRANITTPAAQKSPRRSPNKVRIVQKRPYPTSTLSLISSSRQTDAQFVASPINSPARPMGRSRHAPISSTLSPKPKRLRRTEP